jgi:hypothetical protein
MRPTKFAGSGVGVGDSVGGSGVPIAIGALGGRSTAGIGGVVRKLLRIDTIETITRNETHNKILSFHAPMERFPKQLPFQPANISRKDAEKKERRKGCPLCVFVDLCVFA